jgi:zinc transporter ZupT
MIADNIITEARARIVWGEASSSVRDFLIANGVPVLETGARLEEFQRERRRELRRIGLRNVLIGVVLAAAAGVALYVGASDLVPEVNREPGIRMALVFFLGVAAFLALRIALPAL